MRVRISGCIVLLMALLLLPVLNGCVALQKKEAPQKKLFLFPVAGDDVTGMIAEIEDDSEAPPGADKLYQLSFLYSHRFNPEPDYKKSLEMLEKYRTTAPGETQLESAEHISSLLEKIISQEQMIRKKRLALKKEIMKKKLLIDENRDLKKKITGLKSLDIRLEKQRLGVN